MKRHLPWLLVAIVLLLCEALPGGFTRPDLQANQEQALVLAGALDREHSLAQTFTPGRDGLCALEVFARIPSGRLSAAYSLRLTLESGAGAPLAATTVLLSQLQAQPLIRFGFPAQARSSGQVYRLRVESDAPPNTVSLLASREDVYPGGELRQDGAPAGRDLAFRSYTALTPTTLGLALWDQRVEFGFGLGLALLAGLIGATGLGLLGWLPAGTDWAAGLAWALGLGLSLVILLFAALGAAWGWGLVGLALLAAVRGFAQRSRWQSLLRLGGTGRAAQLMGVFAAALAVRLVQVHDLPAPLWVDGCRHAEMIARILETGGLPPGLLYHTGYHSLVAAVQPLGTRLPDPSLARLMLLVGQGLGALGPVGLYPLARRLLKGSHAGALAAVIALSFLAIFPAYLFNWSRYPFQLGLALLPLVLAAGMEFSPTCKKALILWLVLASGMALAHYGTLSFGLSFGLVWLAVERPAWARLRSKKTLARLALGAAALLGVGLAWAGLRFGPERLASLGDALAEILAQSRQAGADLDYTEILRLHLRGAGLGLALAGGLGAALALYANRRLLALSLGWFLAQAALIAIQAPLLGYALASYANLLLALGLPFSILAGSLVAEGATLATRAMARRSPPRWLKSAVSWVAPLGVSLILLGGLAQAGLLNPAAALAAPQDAAALAWLRANTPPDAVVLINSNRWGGGEIVPCDGGAWVQALAGRRSVFLDAAPAAGSLAAWIRQQGVTYVYLGRFAGFLTPAGLAGELPEPAYMKDGIQIYKIIR